MTDPTSGAEASPRFRYGIVLSYNVRSKVVQIDMLDADGHPMGLAEPIELSYYDWILPLEEGRRPSRNYDPDPITGQLDMRHRQFSPPSEGYLVMVYESTATRRTFWTRPNAVLRRYPSFGQTTVENPAIERPADLVAILDLTRLTDDRLRGVRSSTQHHFEFGPGVVYFGPNPLTYVATREPGFRCVGLRWDPTIRPTGEVRRILDPEQPPVP